MLVGLNGFGRRNGPLATLAALAMARHRLTSRLGQDGAEAELAAALCPARFVLVGRVSSTRVVVATDDAGAAEIVWPASGPPIPDAVVA